MKLRKTFIVLLLHGASVIKCSDFLSHVEDSILAVEDRISQTRSLEELEEAYAYGDKSRFQDMFYDLNSFYPEHTENNQVKPNEPKVKKNSSTEKPNYKQKIYDYGLKRSKKLGTKNMKEKKQTNGNFMDRRGFIDDGFYFNSPFEGVKPLWSETMIREGIGKNEKNENGENDNIKVVEKDTWGQWGMRHIRKTPNFDFKMKMKQNMKIHDEEKDSSTEEQFISEVFETTTSKSLKQKDRKRRKKRRKTKFSEVLGQNISAEFNKSKEEKNEFSVVVEQKLLPNFNDSEGQKIENNMNELVAKPLTKEWENLFVPFTSSSSSTSTETTTTQKKSKFNLHPRIRKVKRNQNSGIFQKLFSTYCGFEEALQLLQMCKSSKSLEEKSYVKQEKYVAKPNYNSDLFSNDNIFTSAVDALKRIFY